MVHANPIFIMGFVTVGTMVWHIQWGLVILLYFSLSGVKIHEPPCKSCKYTKESILMGHTLWYGAGKELASNLTAAWCRDSNTMVGIPCFVQRLPGLTHCFFFFKFVSQANNSKTYQPVEWTRRYKV